MLLAQQEKRLISVEKKYSSIPSSSKPIITLFVSIANLMYTYKADVRAANIEGSFIIPIKPIYGLVGESHN